MHGKEVFGLAEVFVGDRAVSVEETSHLYSTLTTEERDELLQCILIAVSAGEHFVVDVVQTLCLVIASEELEGARWLESLCLGEGGARGQRFRRRET